MTKEFLLLKIFEKCYKISTTTKADVFFDYSPHCNSYSIHYYINGWDENSNAEYLRNSTLNYITQKQLLRTLDELENLYEKCR